MAAACLLLACACAEPYRLPEAGEAPARPWLTQCGADDDCASGSECLAGACTIGCGIDSLELCAGLSADAVCDTTLSACVLPCGVSTSCQALGAGYACEQGRCRATRDPRGLWVRDAGRRGAAFHAGELFGK